jgi:tetratricopeptide (TPR) repeat protein
MRRVAVGIAVLALFHAWTQSASAGVYSNVEPAFPLNDKLFRQFQELSLIPLRQIGGPEAKQSWQKCYKFAGQALEQLKTMPQAFTVEDRLNIGTCLIRMLKFEDAILVLEETSRQDPSNFLVVSTLGTAYMLAGKNELAAGRLGIAMMYWRKPYAELSQSQQEFLAENMEWKGDHPYGWYARCEQIQYRLAKLRRRELGNIKPLNFNDSLTKLDALSLLVQEPGKDFQPVQFVGPSGKFEPGKIAAAEKAKLPPDAIAVVQQLLIWMPQDLRLYWLLGELMNADGDVDNAEIVFGEMLAKFAVIKAGKFNDPSPKKWQGLFLEKFPEVGQRLQALREYLKNRKAPEDVKDADSKKPAQDPGKKPAGTDEPSVAPLKIAWQTLVGFGAGMLVAFFATWQFREIKRRRQARAFQVTIPVSAADEAHGLPRRASDPSTGIQR